MSAIASIPGFPFGPRTYKALPPALLFSIAFHAVAGGLVFHGWHREKVEIPQVLSVVLAPAPTLTAAPPPPPKHVHSETPDRPAIHHPAPILAVAPTPTSAPVEHVAPAPVVPAPVAEAPPAPVVVAKAPPSTIDATARSNSIEPPHFNVAYLNNPTPAYPSIARKLGLEGVVLLRVQVSAAGAPERVAIAKTSGVQVLDEAAIKAVQGWSFVPAKRGDTPVAHPVEVPIRFQLKN